MSDASKVTSDGGVVDMVSSAWRRSRPRVSRAGSLRSTVSCAPGLRRPKLPGRRLRSYRGLRGRGGFGDEDGLEQRSHQGEVTGCPHSRPAPDRVRNMMRAGIGEKQAMLISGHKTRSMFDTYQIIDERDVEMAGKACSIRSGRESSGRSSGSRARRGR